MKKLTDKSRRTLAVAGIGIVCVALIIGISYRFSPGKVKASDVVSSSTSSSNGVVVEAVGTDSASLGSSSSSVSAASATGSSSTTDQKIQSDVSKPAAPSSKPQAQGSTANPSQTPSYSSRDTTSGQSSGGQNFQKKDGKIYVPGFGWVTDNGGGGAGTSGTDSGDINKQVGQMD